MFGDAEVIFQDDDAFFNTSSVKTCQLTDIASKQFGSESDLKRMVSMARLICHLFYENLMNEPE